MASRFLSAVLIIAFSALTALAQAPATIAKEYQLTVRVTYENDRSAPQNLSVQLVNAMGGIVQTQMTDSVGMVTFRGVEPARYKLRVSGEGVASTESGVIDLADAGPNTTQYVRVRRLDTGGTPGG